MKHGIQFLFIVICVPGNVLSALSHLLLMKGSRVFVYYYLHFADKEIETQKGKVTCLSVRDQ